MFDIEQIKADVVASLGLTRAVEIARVDGACAMIIDHILTSHDWSFLDTEGNLNAASSTNEYGLARDFLYPLPGTVYSSEGNIEIVSPEWLHTTYPDLTDLSGIPQFCIFLGLRKIQLYPVNEIVGTLQVNYGYHKRGGFKDLSFDPGFADIIRNGIIKNVAKPGDTAQVQGQIAYFGQLKNKASMFERHFGGDSKFKLSERDESFQVTRKDIAWAK